MSRGGILLAVALTLALSPAAAAGQTAPQPDLMFVSRGGAVVTGDEIYGDDGVGQQRSVIVDKRTVLVIRIQNDGDAEAVFIVSGSSQSSGFTVRYLMGRTDVTRPATARNDLTGRLAPRVRPGEFKTLRVVIEVDPNAPLGAKQTLLVNATNSPAIDAIKVEVTKTSTPT